MPWGFNETDSRCVKVKNFVKKEIIKSVNLGYINFISGMALGFDMICAEIVIELKKIYSNIKLICALPCKHQDKFWNSKQRIRYENIVKHADLVLCLHEKYTKDCMEERNKYMVDNSSMVIALFNGKKGGTYKTIEYAKMNKKNIVIIKV